MESFVAERAAVQGRLDAHLLNVPLRSTMAHAAREQQYRDRLAELDGAIQHVEQLLRTLAEGSLPHLLEPAAQQAPPEEPLNPALAPEEQQQQGEQQHQEQQLAVEEEARVEIQPSLNPVAQSDEQAVPGPSRQTRPPLDYSPLTPAQVVSLLHSLIMLAAH
jgi:hypothetical protein